MKKILSLFILIICNNSFSQEIIQEQDPAPVETRELLLISKLLHQKTEEELDEEYIEKKENTDLKEPVRSTITKNVFKINILKDF